MNIETFHPLIHYSMTGVKSTLTCYVLHMYIIYYGRGRSRNYSPSGAWAEHAPGQPHAPSGAPAANFRNSFNTQSSQ